MRFVSSACISLLICNAAFAEIFDLKQLLDTPEYHNEHGFSMFGAFDDMLGIDAKFLGDVNNDGLQDIGVCASDTQISNGQGCYVIYGQQHVEDYPTDLTLLREPSNQKGAHIASDKIQWAGDCFRMIGSGDVNGDGIDDLAVQCDITFDDDLGNATPKTKYRGLVAVFYGGEHLSETVLNGDFDITDMFLPSWDNSKGYVVRGILDYELEINYSNYDYHLAFNRFSLGSYLSNFDFISDVNGDGIDDLAIGGHAHRFIVYGHKQRFTDDELAIFDLSRLGPENGNDGSLGFMIRRPEKAILLGGQGAGGLASLGDINNDGHIDIGLNFSTNNISSADDVVAAYEELDSLYVLFGPFDSVPEILIDELLSSNFDNGAKGFAIHTDDDSSSRYPGRNIDGIGDINSDGVDDFLFQQSQSNHADTDFIVFGKDYTKGDNFPVEFKTSDIGAKDDDFIVPGVAIYGTFTVGVGYGGDFDNDGTLDVCFADYRGGSVTVVFGREGRPFPSKVGLFPDSYEHSWKDDYDTLTIAGSTVDSYVGDRCDLSVDLNSDGYSDLLMTGSSADTNKEEIYDSPRGRAYVLYGKERKNAAPIAVLEGPSEITSGQTVTFSAESSYDKNDSIVSFRWNSQELEIDSMSGQTLTLVVPDVDQQVTAILGVTITDGFGATDVAEVEIQIQTKPADPPVQPDPAPQPEPQPLAATSSSSGSGTLGLGLLFCSLMLQLRRKQVNTRY